MRQRLPDGPGRFDEIARVVLVFLDPRGDGEDVRVEDDVLGGEVDFVHEDSIGARADRDLALHRVGLPVLVERHHHDGRAMPTRELRLRDEGVVPFLQADRVDDALALQALEAGLDHRPLGRVDHHRHLADVRFRGDEIEELDHGRARIEHRLVHVHVDELGAVLDLAACHRERRGVVAGEDQAGECLRPGDVGTLADVHEERVVADVERFQAGQAQLRLDLRHHPRRDALHGAGDRGDVRGRGAAAAADDVDQAGLRELAQQRCRVLGALVVAGLRQRIGQSGIRVRTDVGIGNARQFLDVRPHQFGAEGAVEAERERTDVSQRVPERGRRLSGEGASALVGDGPGDHHRQALAGFLEPGIDGEQRSFGVQRVEHGLDQQQVDAALDQPAQCFVVGGDEFAEADVARARVVHVGRDRGGAGGRSEHAGDEARARGVALGELVGDAARQTRGLDVELVHDVLKVVVRHRDRVGIEGVGLEDVRTRLQVCGMDLTDDLRPREREQVVVALLVVREIGEARPAVFRLGQLVALDHRTHRAVQDDDALAQLSAEEFDSGVAV